MGRCYDHNFLRFSPFSVEKLALFLKTYVMLHFEEFSSVSSQKRQFFRRFFCVNILKSVTPIPGPTARLRGSTSPGKRPSTHILPILRRGTSTPRITSVAETEVQPIYEGSRPIFGQTVKKLFIYHNRSLAIRRTTFYVNKPPNKLKPSEAESSKNGKWSSANKKPMF
jgi:hypothetical protein